MDWFKIILAEEDAGGHLGLTFQVSKIYARNGGPKDLSLVTQYDDIDNPTLDPIERRTYYLTPSAAKFCSELLEAYKAEPCEKPRGLLSNIAGRNIDQDAGRS